MKTFLNLLPVAVRRRQLFRRRLRRWCAVWIAVAVVGAVGGLVWRSRIEGAHAEVESLDRRCGNLRELAADNDRLKKEIEAARSRESQVVETEQAGVPLGILAVVSRCCGPLRQHLRLERVRIEESRQEASPPRPGELNPPSMATRAVLQQKIQLSGSASHDQAVGSLVAALRASEAFDSVELVSSQSVQSQGESVRQFQIRCRH